MGWLDRAKAEYLELRDRLGLLGKFIESDEFEGLPPVDRMDLHEQVGLMSDYLTVLGRRVSRHVVK